MKKIALLTLLLINLSLSFSLPRNQASPAIFSVTKTNNSILFRHTDSTLTAIPCQSVASIVSNADPSKIVSVWVVQQGDYDKIMQFDYSVCGFSSKSDAVDSLTAWAICDTSGGVGDVSQSALDDSLTNVYTYINNNIPIITDSATITSYDVLNSQNAPPGSPATGDTYLVGTSPSGAWVGHAKDIAEWDGADWVFTDGVQGDFLYNATNALTYIFRSGNWVQTTGIPALNNGNTISSGLRIGTNNARSLTFETNNVNRGRFDSIGRFHVYNLPVSTDTFVNVVDVNGKFGKIGKTSFLSGIGGGGTQYGGNNTLYVSKQGSNATGTKGNRSKPYLTIQAAINAAVGGDKVVVMEGTYIENIALKDSVSLISETWGAATIQHDTITNSWGVSSPSATSLGAGIYYDIFIWGFRITNPTGETTIKIQAQKLIVKLAYLEVKSKNVTYQSKIQCYASSTSSAVFECDVVDINSISGTTQFGFDGISAPAAIGSVYAIPSCYIKVCNFTEVTTTPQDYIGWQNWNWKVDAINSNTINASTGFGEIYHQNCNGHVGTYRSIRTGSQGNNSTVFYIPDGNSTLTIDYFYSEGQERIITCGTGNDIINIGWMQTDGLIFISPAAGKTTILNAQTLKRINAKATSIFYIFPTGAAGKVKLNCNYCESNGSGSGTIYTYNNATVAIDIYLQGEFYNSNSSNSLVIQDDASTATVKYKVNGGLILRNNQSAGTKAYGTFNHATTFYINGGLGVTNTNAGTAPTVVGTAILIDTGL